ncbi:cytochrome C oxidase subunit IV family protein [Marininema halotolerans]|uniref:Cytochrome o ubiquinol oxidase operon protein cyoD n=1 Tax=Marininema halotolerans TaxID=1155944 RepID=A0A1I6SLG9_9BACL|nr:cytochrome C oxidase subunit IV family protein [Marininema halotolerans]SFS77807.1 cytochrome o ubiquinol oxidase operon protein cyoD [Marininema halotolerans]
MSEQQHASAKHHITGFVLSLLLTFAALFLALNTPLSVGLKLTVIIVLAVFQMLVQLVYFMHVTEGSKIYQIISFSYGIFVAVCVVAGSIWLMLLNGMSMY